MNKKKIVLKVKIRWINSVNYGFRELYMVVDEDFDFTKIESVIEKPLEELDEYDRDYEYQVIEVRQIDIVEEDPIILIGSRTTVWHIIRRRIWMNS